MREREQQLCGHQPVALQEGLHDRGDEGQLPPASCLAVQLQEGAGSPPLQLVSSHHLTWYSTSGIYPSQSSSSRSRALFLLLW